MTEEHRVGDEFVGVHEVTEAPPERITGIRIERFAYTPVGTFGRIVLPNFNCFTVEKPWRDNIPFESCIPEGTYSAVLGKFHRGGYPAYELIEVPGRTLIKLHRANTEDELLGCIAPGLLLGCIHGKWGVQRSTEAFEQLMLLLNGKKIISVEITHSGILSQGTTLSSS